MDMLKEATRQAEQLDRLAGECSRNIDTSRFPLPLLLRWRVGIDGPVAMLRVTAEMEVPDPDGTVAFNGACPTCHQESPRPVKILKWGQVFSWHELQHVVAASQVGHLHGMVTRGMLSAMRTMVIEGIVQRGPGLP